MNEVNAELDGDSHLRWRLAGACSNCVAPPINAAAQRALPERNCPSERPRERATIRAITTTTHPPACPRREGFRMIVPLVAGGDLGVTRKRMSSLPYAPDPPVLNVEQCDIHQEQAQEAPA